MKKVFLFHWSIIVDLQVVNDCDNDITNATFFSNRWEHLINCFIIYLVLNKGNLHIQYWKNITAVFVSRDWYRYHHPFLIPLKMILITWLRRRHNCNTEQDFLMFKYMINIIWYGSFRITSCNNPRPISSVELKLSGWYGNSHTIFSMYQIMIKNAICNLFLFNFFFNNMCDIVCLNFRDCTLAEIRYYHPSLPLYLPADSISKTRIKVRVSWAGLINSQQELSPNSSNI